MTADIKDFKTKKVWIHFAGYFACFLIAGVIAAIPRFVMKETGVIVFLSELVRIPLTLATFYFYTKYVVKYSLNQTVLNKVDTNIITWIFIGTILPLVTLAIFYATGNLTVLISSVNLRLDLILWGIGMSLAAGFVEEVFVRGYLFNLFRIKYRIGIAFFVPALFFTSLHLGAAGSALNILQLLIAGLLVSLLFTMVYLYTKSIWNACVVHAIWNIFFLGKILSFEGSSSDIELKESIISINLGSNELINGSKFGIDASLPAISVYLIVSIILWILYKKKKTATNISLALPVNRNEYRYK